MRSTICATWKLAVKATKKYGGTAEVAMSYTISAVHTEDYFVKLAGEIAKMGADIICIKDMANLLLPYSAYSLIRRLKAETNLPIVMHTHDTTGTRDDAAQGRGGGRGRDRHRAQPAGRRHSAALHRSAGGHPQGQRV